MRRMSDGRQSLGSAWQDGRARAGVALAVGLLLVAQELILVHRASAPVARLVPALLGTLVLLVLAGGHGPTLGLARPGRRDLARWARISGYAAASMAVLGTGGALAMGVSGHDPFPDASRPDARWFLVACLLAPLLEELVYRLAIVPSLMARFGRVPAILVSGGTFAAGHFVAGTAAPTNVCAGFVLAWCYVASGNLALPILLHAAGNLAVGVAWLVLS